MPNKNVFFMGGGTVNKVRPHFALSAPAYGTAARRMEELSKTVLSKEYEKYHKNLVLTRMADPEWSTLETNSDVEKYLEGVVADPDTKMIFFSIAMSDFSGSVEGPPHLIGREGDRLSSAHGHHMRLTPAKKVIGSIREKRKDIFLIGFKTTAGATQEEMFEKGLTLLKRSHCNLVLVNDIKTRWNMVVTPEQSSYYQTQDRDEVFTGLLRMSAERAKGTFSRTEVVVGYPGTLAEMPSSFDFVVSHCIQHGAYKPFDGVTVGHYAWKSSDEEIWCSRRRHNYLVSSDLVSVQPYPYGNVMAFGGKPSAGVRSQLLMFDEHPGLDCIVHFHCPLKPGSSVPTRPQEFFECGSHECGKNTSSGLAPMTTDGSIWAVYLEKHGPNIMFSSNVDPHRVVEFIDKNFDLSKTTHGV